MNVVTFISRPAGLFICTTTLSSQSRKVTISHTHLGECAGEVGIEAICMMGGARRDTVSPHYSMSGCGRRGWWEVRKGAVGPGLALQVLDLHRPGSLVSASFGVISSEGFTQSGTHSSHGRWGRGQRDWDSSHLGISFLAKSWMSILNLHYTWQKKISVSIILTENNLFLQTTARWGGQKV